LCISGPGFITKLVAQLIKLKLNNFNLDLDIFNSFPDTFPYLKVPEQNLIDMVDDDECLRFRLSSLLESWNPKLVNDLIKKYCPPFIIPVVTVVDNVDIDLNTRSPKEFLRKEKDLSISKLYGYVGSFSLLRLYVTYFLVVFYTFTSTDLKQEEKDNIGNFYEQLVEKFSSIASFKVLFEDQEIALTCQNFKVFDGFLPTISQVKEFKQDGGEKDKLRVPYKLTSFIDKMLQKKENVNDDE